MDEVDLALSCHLNVIPPLCYGNLPLSHLRDLRIGTIALKCLRNKILRSQHIPSF